MSNKIYFFVFFLALVSSSSVIAQSNLSFGYSGVQHEDTLHIGDSIHFSFWLINQGSTNINDSISISCETFDIIGNSISSMSIGENYNTIGSLNVGDSIFVTITEEVTYSSYILGDNIVVIWPAFIGSGGVDTSMTDIYILASIPTGSELELSSNKLDIFPNPSSSNIYLNTEIDIKTSYIHISDCFGNIVFKQSQVDLNHFIFNVSVLKKGVYFVVFGFDNRKITRKIIVN